MQVAPSPAPPEPREQLDPRAHLYWQVRWGLGMLLLLALAAPAAFGLWLWSDGLLAPALVIALVLALGAFAVFVLAPLSWRHWRYELREDELDLQHGLWTVTRTLVPLARVQHVDTRRGPLQARFGLATLVLFTAAGASTIPALRLAVAYALREQIAALAKRFDDV